MLDMTQTRDILRKVLADDNAPAAAEVSRKIGRNRSYITQFLGQSTPDYLPTKIAVKVSKILHIPIEQLVEDEEILHDLNSGHQASLQEDASPYTPPKAFRDRFIRPRKSPPPPKQVDIYSNRFVKYITGEADLTELELDDLRSMYDAELAGKKVRFFGKEIAMRDVIPEIYRQADRIVGEVLDKIHSGDLGKNVTLLIVSDHGFAPFYYGMNVNNFLVENLLRLPVLENKNLKDKLNILEYVTYQSMHLPG